MLDSLASSVEFAGEVPWRRRPALYREHAVFVTADADQAREQRACGARVVMAGGSGSAGGSGGAGGDGRDEPALRERLASAAAERPLMAAQVLPGLREIFTEHATAVRLAGLARLAGLPDGVATGRQVAVLARVEAAAGAARLADALCRQRLRPAEVVAVVDVPEDPAELACRAVAAALGGLADLGVAIRTVPAGPGSPWLEQAAGVARAPWAAPWPPPAEHQPGEHYLLDLVCARECSQADAVGYADASFAFTSRLEAALGRREFFGAEGALLSGPRLFSIG
jgi:hypothetical protein